MTTINFDQRRIKRDAERYRLCQAAALQKLFRQAHGRSATSTQELGDFCRVAHGIPNPLNPFDVLTPDEIALAMRKD